jgi:hypothetical protein
MPSVDLILTGLGAGKASNSIGALSVHYSGGVANQANFAAGVAFVGGKLTVPFSPALFRCDNTDSTSDLTVQCASGAQVIVGAGTAALLYCDGNAVIEIGATGPSRIITETGTSRTLKPSDNEAIIAFTNGSAVTLTVPVGLGNFQCGILQLGAGQVTPTASSTTINNRQSQTKTAGQYALASLIAYTADTFILAGDTA